jgi:predicted RNA binding protein YcfA (HicA-like mRNA interferase family)
MKLPRDVTGRRLVQALRKLSYVETRQRGSHIRVTTHRDGEHHEAIPDHHPVKCGTLNGILKSVARHHRMTTEELLKLLDL